MALWAGVVLGALLASVLAGPPARHRPTPVIIIVEQNPPQGPGCVQVLLAVTCIGLALLLFLSRG